MHHHQLRHFNFSFFKRHGEHRHLHSFPTRRSSDLRCVAGITANAERCQETVERNLAICTALAPRIGYDKAARSEDTRLNSSHTVISYAVFCLKKKKYLKVKYI